MKALLLTLLLVAPAAAQQPSGTYTRCMGAAAQRPAAQVACAEAETRLWESRLAAALQGLAGLPRVDRDAQALLRDAQTTWLTFRERSCVVEGRLMGNEAHRAGCVMQHTIQRAFDLEGLGREIGR